MEVFGKFFTCQIESKVKKFSTPKHKMHDLIHTRKTFSHSPVLMENVLSWIYIFPFFLCCSSNPDCLDNGMYVVFHLCKYQVYLELLQIAVCIIFWPTCDFFIPSQWFRQPLPSCFHEHALGAWMWFCHDCFSAPRRNFVFPEDERDWWLASIGFDGCADRAFQSQYSRD